jgi:hypothetical protein
MRIMVHLFIVFLFLSWTPFATPLYSARTGNVPGGEAAPETVTMPWKHFMEIWEKYREPEKKRNRAFAYEGAVYEGRAVIEKNKYFLKFEATIRIDTFSDDRILVSVISAELSPEKMLLDSNPTGYIKKAGYYHVALPKKGRHTVTSFFTITLEAERWPRNFNLPLVPIARSEIKLDVTDADVEARFDPGVVVETVGRAEGDRIRGIVPAVGNTAIRWLKRSQKQEMIPLKMGAVVHSYISLAENGANIKSDVAFQILQGETHYFQIQVPDTIDILDVTAVDGDEIISQWYAEDTGNGRMIHIYASYRHKTKFAVRLDCEHTVTRTNYQFTLPHMIPQAVERYESLMAVGSQANVEISESVVERAEGRDVRFVPEEIQAFARGRSLFYYKVLGDDFKLAFDVKSHEKATVVKTRIERIEADSVVTEVGTVMTKATYQVKNNQAQFLKLQLPDGSKLLSAFTNGREIQPVMDGDTLLVPLDKSTTASFPVEIAWLSKTGEFGFIGRRSILLPSSPVSIDELSWRLYTPEAWQMFYFGGNVERKKPGGAFWSALLGAMSQTAAEQVPSAYAGGYASKSYKYNVENVRKRFKKGRKLDSGDYDLGLRNSQVQVQIPVTGNRYRFSSYLVKGFTPEIAFFYMSDNVHRMVGFGYAILALIFTFSIMGCVVSRSEFTPHVPRTHYWWIGLGVALFAGLLLTVLKLGVFADVAKGAMYGVVLFAFWQNRRESRKFHHWVSGTRAYFPELLLAVLILCVVLPVWGGWLGVAAFFSVASIIFHGICFRFLKWFSKRRKAKKEALSVAVIFFSILMVYSAPAWASGSGDDDPGRDAVISREQQTEVNLAWPTVEHMLRTIEEREERLAKETKPGYLFGTVRIDGEITEKYASLRIDVPLRIVSEQYVKIPLTSVTTPIAKALYNKKSLALFRENDHICFEAGKDEDREGLLQIYLSSPVREQGGVKEFMVHSPLLQGGAVELRFGTDIKSVKLFNVAWEKREDRVIRAALGNAQQLRGELATFIRRKEAADEEDKRVKKRYATTYTLVSLEDEIATYYSSIRYRILNEHVREFRIKLPRDVIVHEIVGEDLEGWRVEPEKDGMNAYIIKVMYPVADRYDLSVRFETAAPADNKAFNIPCLLVEEVARDTGYIGIEMQGRGEIAIEKLDKARQIDIRELPDIIRTDAKAPFVYAFRYIERPYRIGFNICKHKGLQMDPAIADRIDYTRVLSPKGTLLSQAQIWIRNSRKQYLTFSLPKGARIISTFQDGKSVKPSINEKGTLLLPLKRQSVTPFVLDVVFEDPDIDLNKAGSLIKLRYPQVDVPVSRVTSNIYIPKKMKVFAPEGDFHETTQVNYVKWTSHQAARAPLADHEQQSLSLQLQTSFADNESRGTRSLKINIPRHGQRVALNAFYIPSGEPLETHFFIMHRYLFGCGYVFALLFCVILGGALNTYARRPLYWCVAALSLILFYCMIISSWKVIAVGVLSGYILGRLIQRFKAKREISGGQDEG